MTETHKVQALRSRMEKSGELPQSQQVEIEKATPQKEKFPKQHYSIKMYDINGYVREAVVEARTIDSITQQLKTLCSNRGLLLDTTGKMFNLANIVVIEKPVVIDSNKKD